MQLACQMQEFILHFQAKVQACAGLVVTFASRLSAEIECYCYPWLSTRVPGAVFQKTWPSALPSWKRGLAPGSGGAAAGVGRAGTACSGVLSVAMQRVRNGKKSFFITTVRSVG